MPVVEWIPVSWREPVGGDIYDVWMVSRISGATMRVTDLRWVTGTQEWVRSSCTPIASEPGLENYEVTHFMSRPRGPSVIADKEGVE